MCGIEKLSLPDSFVNNISMTRRKKYEFAMILTTVGLIPEDQKKIRKMAKKMIDFSPFTGAIDFVFANVCFIEGVCTFISTTFKGTVHTLSWIFCKSPF